MNTQLFTVFDSWLWVVLASFLHCTAVLLTALHCLRRRREPSATILWLFASWSLPVLGVLIYLAFGVDRIPDKGFHKNFKDQKLLAERKAREDAELSLSYWRSVHQAVAAEPLKKCEKEINKAINTILPDYPLLGGNSIQTLICGDEFYPELFSALEQAKHHIHLQSFIIGPDSTGRKLMDLLHKKAKEGVTVRLLYDTFGSTKAVFRGMFRKNTKTSNMHISGWTQVNPLKRRFQVNLRNHRKSVIIDGITAFFGGMNLHDDNISTPQAPAIRDYHFRVAGPIVQELQYSFMRDWYFMTDEDPEVLLQEKHFPHVGSAGNSLVRLVNSGPTSEMEAIADVFFMLINAAQREIIIVTPYFVPTRDIMRALRTSAMKGVHVRLVVPEKNNHFYAGLAGKALYQELLDAGVNIYERRPPFIHAKALIIDSSVSVIGTSNFDNRSLRLNYETNLVVYDELFSNKLKKTAIEEISNSRQINPSSWAKRPALKSIAENLAYLMMPVL